MSNKELILKDLEEKAHEQELEYMRNLERYHWLKENGYILFETIVGSQAHGTNTETSDIDKAFVFVLPEDDILGLHYKEQLKIHKDYMGYEIRRFLELLKKGNPTVLELLNSPEDCILVKHPAFDILLSQKEKFVTKVCENAFYGYARQQRQKAEGLDKMMNWEVNRVVRKGPLDFCYVPDGYDAVPIKNWLEKRGLDQLFCALTAVNHCRDLYSVFYDHEAHKTFSELIPENEREAYKAKKKELGQSMGLGYKGIAFEDSNDIRLSNIPMEERKNSICHISYNKDAYRKHCDDYKKYQTWLENRNENRWVEIVGHGQQIDGKNMMHFMRLVLIGREIASGQGLRIRREDAQELLKIRRGEVSLQELFDKSDEILAEMKTMFQNSNLPGEVSGMFIHEMLVNIRKDFYYKKESYSSFIENREKDNIFVKKYYGQFSELQTIMRAEIDKCIKEEYNDDKEAFLEDYNFCWLNVIPQDRWPKQDGELLDTENVTILSSTRDKVTVAVGGDWQKGLQFDIVAWGDIAVPINIKPIGDWKEEVKYEHFLKELGYESGIS